MVVHDVLELFEGCHVVLAAFLRDDADLLHDVSYGRVKTLRIDSRLHILLAITITDCQPVLRGQ